MGTPRISEEEDGGLGDDPGGGGGGGGGGVTEKSALLHCRTLAAGSRRSCDRARHSIAVTKKYDSINIMYGVRVSYTFSIKYTQLYY